MKRYNAIYFLLFLLLVMGAFASMAQNSYGLKIIGGVAFVFGALFGLELLQYLTGSGKKDVFVITELAAMIPFAIIFGCRVFNIYIPFIEWVFAAAGIVLVIFYIRKLLIRYRRLEDRNKALARLGVVFHLSIIFFLVTVILSPFAILWTKWIGVAGFVLLLAFIIGALIKKQYLLEGNKITPLKMVTGYRDHSVLLALLFLLISLYATLNIAGLIPDIYSDENPRAYADLVNKAASGEEKPVQGKYKYELFMEQYQALLRHMKK